MLSASHALSSSKTQSYYREEYAAPGKRYFSQENELQGYWHGRLAAELGLTGTVQDLAFDRLALGQNPETGEQWIEHRDTIVTRTGKEAAHRAAWDLTIHAPKGVSLAALVGGDDRILGAHEAANRAALDAMEYQVQARLGGNKAPLTTEKWIAASFLHDTARPVEIETALGEKIAYPAPHLHSHNVVFNMTEDLTGQARSLQTKAIFEAQSFGTAVYRAELALRLQELGYQVYQNEKGAPEIRGFSADYLAAESLRSIHITERLEQLGVSGRRAREIIAHQDRAAKLDITADEVRFLHRAHGELYGNQAQALVREALERGKKIEQERLIGAGEAVSFAIRRLSEREAVFDHFEVARDALNYAQGHLRLSDIEAEIRQRRTLRVQELGQKKDLLAVFHHREHSPGARYTTPAALARERAIIDITHRGIGNAAPLAPELTQEHIRLARTPEGHPLNPAQQSAVWNVLTTEDRILALQGVAGSGKTTSLRLIREYAEANGYEVRGLAPTSGATKALRDAGISSETIQRHLRSKDAEPAPTRLYFLDESSLSSTKQVHQFLVRLPPQDRVLLIGDTRQHQSVEAGRIFAELQSAGMTTHQLNYIVRQRSNPELLAAIEHLSQGKVPEALSLLEQQHRIHELRHRKDRFAAIARDYAQIPAKTLVVSADNRSREELNIAIRQQLRHNGVLSESAYHVRALVARQDMTKEDHRVAAAYQVGDVVRYERANRSLGIAKGDYATVLTRDSKTNLLTVQRQRDGQTLSYDPAKQTTAQLFKEQSRDFAVGDRLQLTASWREKGLANRQLGTIEALEPNGNVTVRMDENNRRVQWNLRSMRHVDYGYTMTSYSSQGATVDRVLVQIDTGESRVRALNDKVMAYVAASRGRHDLQIYTDVKADLEHTLNHVDWKPTALSREQVESFRKGRKPVSKQKEIEHAHDLAFTF